MSDLINQSAAAKYLEGNSDRAERNRVLLSWLSDLDKCQHKEPHREAVVLQKIKMSRILERGFAHVELTSKETYLYHADGGCLTIDTTMYGEDGEEHYETDLWYVDNNGVHFTVELDTKLPQKRK